MGIFNINPPLPFIPAEVTFAGQSILITGATAGIGFECARELLVRKTSMLYLAVRDMKKGEIARKELLEDAKIREANPNANIEVLELDLSLYSSVLAFSKQLYAKVERLDAVILNAGIGTFKFTILPAKPNNEEMLQVNFLSNAMLSLLLLPLLEKGSQPGHPTHIVFVASIGAHQTSMEKKPFTKTLSTSSIVTSLNTSGTYGALERYSMTKMFVQMWTRELAAKISPSKVIVNSVCPGLTMSSFDRGLPFYLRYLVTSARYLVGRTTREGATTYIGAMLAPKETQGAFYSDGAVLDPSPFQKSLEGTEMQTRVWFETLGLLKAEDPNIVIPGN